MRSDPALAALLDHRPAFVRFVQRRIDSESVAEDIVQDALVRSLDRIAEVQEEARVGWFYKVLENAVTDHYRRTATATKGLERLGDELKEAVVKVDDAPARTCKCVAKVKAELKPEYAQALDRVEVDGVAVKDFAAEAGISATNAGVRIFRAREALKKKVATTCGHCAENGCVDCSCVH